MDSINKQQEDNIEDLQDNEANGKIKELAEKAESCFFCTNIKTGLPFSTRPMAIQKVEEDGSIWFFSSIDSSKNSEIAQDPFVQLLFQTSAHAGFLSVYGIAEIVEDNAKVDELWSPIVKVWFQGGKDDPKLSLIKVIPTQGYYWDTKHGKIVSFVKMAASIVSGKTMDDSIEGKLIVGD